MEYQVREPVGEAGGALVLFHGRGADEHDLHPLLDYLDPDRRLLGVTPRGPLSLPPGGAHWYKLQQVGFPDRETFLTTYDEVGSWLDGFLDEHGISHDRTVLGGFSQGAVMAYSFGLGGGRPRPAAVTAFSGFIPTVEGFELDLSEIPAVAIGHGTFDPVIPVDFGRQAREILEDAGAPVVYREYPLPHAIDPEFLVEVRDWLAEALGSRLLPAKGAHVSDVERTDEPDDTEEEVQDLDVPADESDDVTGGRRYGDDPTRGEK